ncbi:outer membrane lipoprotein SlyB [Arthrobacter sp. CAN_A2]|uniref:hypothetical protein n=1 Tax=Arthrobacter sp. CAN_A2 TaxID=2787718 RepID=UPI0018EF68C3
MEQRSPEETLKESYPGIGIALGAGAGCAIGVAIAGGPGIAIGTAIGAGVGLVVGAIAQSASRSTPGSSSGSHDA